FRSILFLLKKKKIIPYISNKYLLSENKQFFKTNYFYYIYFTFILTIKNSEIIRWFNLLDLNDEFTKFMFVQIIYEICTIQNYLHFSKIKQKKINTNHCFDNTFLDKCSSNIHDIYFDVFVNRFMSILKNHHFEMDKKTDKKTDKKIGEKMGEQMDKKTGEQMEGKFNFTININGEDKNNANNNLKNETVKNVRNPIKQYNEKNLDVEKKIDYFFENLMKLAKENEKKKKLVVKELDINLIIKKNTKKKKNEEKPEEQKKKKKK
ncbi:hypothetical protein PBK173_000514400, partial [Plasmodium berghei]